MASARPRYPSRPLPSQAAPANGPPPQNISSTTAPPVRPPPPQTSASPLTPDVASSRKSRINAELLALLKRPAPASPSPDAPSPYITGIGLYTHASFPAPAVPAFPHQRFAPAGPTIAFVPLGGPCGAQRRTGLRPDVPADVGALYEKMKTAVVSEEAQTRREGYPDPRERFGGGLGLPDIMVPPPPPPMDTMDMDVDVDVDVDRSGAGNKGVMGSDAMDIENVESGEVLTEEEGRPGGGGRRFSVQGDGQTRRAEGRRESAAGDVPMGGMDKNGAPATKRRPSSGAGDRPVSSAGRSVPSVGARKTAPSAPRDAAPAATANTYDPSRDPRRRGR